MTRCIGECPTTFTGELWMAPIRRSGSLRASMGRLFIVLFWFLFTAVGLIGAAAATGREFGLATMHGGDAEPAVAAAEAHRSALVLPDLAITRKIEARRAARVRVAVENGEDEPSDAGAVSPSTAWRRALDRPIAIRAAHGVRWSLTAIERAPAELRSARGRQTDP